MPWLVVLLLAFAPVAEAKKPAEPCAKARVSEDPFSGAEVLKFGAMFWSLEIKGSKSTFLLKVTESSAVDKTLPAGWPVSVALDGGEILELHAEADAAPAIYVQSGTVSTEWTVRLPLTDHQVRALASRTVVAFRYDSSRGEYTWGANDAFRKLVAVAFACAASRAPASH